MEKTLTQLVVEGERILFHVNKSWAWRVCALVLRANAFRLLNLEIAIGENILLVYPEPCNIYFLVFRFLAGFFYRSAVCERRSNGIKASNLHFYRTWGGIFVSKRKIRGGNVTWIPPCRALVFTCSNQIRSRRQADQEEEAIWGFNLPTLGTWTTDVDRFR